MVYPVTRKLAYLNLLAGLRPQDLNPAVLATKIEQMEKALQPLVGSFSPETMIKHLEPRHLTLMSDGIRNVGGLDRVAWVAARKATGTKPDVESLKRFLDTTCRLWVASVNQALAVAYDSFPAQQMVARLAELDMLSRMSSHEVTFAWTNFDACRAIVDVVRSDKHLSQRLPELNMSELVGLFEWMTSSFTVGTTPLTLGQPGYALAQGLSGKTDTSHTIETMLWHRDFVEYPFQLVGQDIYAASSRTALCRSYLALLRRIDWAAKQPPKVKEIYGKGEIFELSVGQLIERYLGPNKRPSGLKVEIRIDGNYRDVDLYWKDDYLTVLAECKSKVPTEKPLNSYGSVTGHRKDITEQLTKRFTALLAGANVRIDGQPTDLINRHESSMALIGVVTEAAVGCHLRSSSEGVPAVHIFHIEGLQMVLRACFSSRDFISYLAFRENYLAKYDVSDEFDVLLAWLTNKPGLAFEVPNPLSLLTCLAEFAPTHTWRHCAPLIAKPIARLDLAGSTSAVAP